MKVLTKAEFEHEKPMLLRELKDSIFIFPSDTVYGLGCDATNEKLVQVVRELKNTTTRRFSVIAPSKQWVKEHCHISPIAQQWVDQLGSYGFIDGEKTAFTLVLPFKNKEALAPNVLQGNEDIAVRIPQHWISSLAEEMGVPIVSTSANPVGGDLMTCLEDLHARVKEGVNYCIYTGEKKGRPSTLVVIKDNEVIIQKR